MKAQIWGCVALFFLPFTLYSEQSIYCPQNHAYISIGMSEDEVIAACGEPISKQESNQPLLQKIPVQQIIYNNQGTDTAFYGVWNLRTGSGGGQIQFDIVDKKVKNIQLNGTDNNGTSIDGGVAVQPGAPFGETYTACGGTAIKVGDPVGKVYGSCGNPSIVNNTYINQIVQTEEKPKVWIYQPGLYQPTFSLTFVNGKLQSINK